MKLILTTTCAAALLGVGVLGAQSTNPSNSSKEVTQDTKTITNSGSTTTSTDTVYGKIEAYNQNRSIKVSVPGKVVTSKSFDLNAKNETVNVAPNLKVGDWVSIQQMTGNDGHKTLTIERTHERASR